MDKIILRASLLLSSFFISLSVFAVEDMPGSADHAKIKRIAGSQIVAYLGSDYGDHDFLADIPRPSKFETQTKEGKLTKLVYLLPEGQTSLFALRNYQEAFAELGEVNEVYSCRKEACDRYIGRDFVWPKAKHFESNYKPLRRLYKAVGFYGEQIYWFATIKSDTAEYAVSFYSTTVNSQSIVKEGIAYGQALVHINIVESRSFKSDLTIVEADEIQKSISEKGHIALYGLFFDTGKDQLNGDSKPALDEISKALKDDVNLNLYVVGHTDNVGSLQSNQQLSERRAASIIQSLTNDFGISADRLLPIGVGLAAPVASNDTEDGRALNRRVELVKR